ADTAARRAGRRAGRSEASTRQRGRPRLGTRNNSKKGSEVVTAGVYARFSSELQTDRSIADQVRLCRRFIEKQGWEYQYAYTDRAVSGATARPACQALLEDARHGRYDVVVAEALDRLSRDQEDVAGLLKRLRFAGVRLFTLAEGEIGELHVGLK